MLVCTMIRMYLIQIDVQTIDIVKLICFWRTSKWAWKPFTSLHSWEDRGSLSALQRSGKVLQHTANSLAVSYRVVGITFKNMTYHMSKESKIKTWKISRKNPMNTINQSVPFLLESWAEGLERWSRKARKTASTSWAMRKHCNSLTPWNVIMGQNDVSSCTECSIPLLQYFAIFSCETLNTSEMLKRTVIRKYSKDVHLCDTIEGPLRKMLGWEVESHGCE